MEKKLDSNKYVKKKPIGIIIIYLYVYKKRDREREREREREKERERGVISRCHVSYDHLQGL